MCTCVLQHFDKVVFALLYDKGVLRKSCLQERDAYGWNVESDKDAVLI